MPSFCRRGCLAALLALLTVGVSAGADESPFAGRWKVLVPQQHFEVALFIVRIDIPRKQATLVAGLGQYDTSALSDVKITSKALTLRLSKGNVRFDLAVLPTAAANKRLSGTVRVGGTILPVWLEPTDEKKLDEKTASRPAPGHAELEKAGKLSTGPARHKALRAVAARHPADLTGFLVQQTLLADLVREKADAAAFAAVVADYRALAAAHGDEMRLAANLDLAGNLLPCRTAAPVTVDCARTAIKLFSDDHPLELKISAHLTLAAGLVAAGKKAEADDVADALDALARKFITTFGTTDESRLRATLQVAEALLASPADPVSQLGMGYARGALGQFSEDTPLDRRLAAYRVVLRGLGRHGKPEEITKTRALVEYHERELDKEFRTTAVPFKVDRAAPRKGKSKRLVLVELFTTADASPALAADAAFDAARRAYPAAEVAFLRYHVDVNAPDALTTPASVARQRFYEAEIEKAVPAALVDGQPTAALGGALPRARADFATLKKQIDAAREKPAGAQLVLEGAEAAGRFRVRATVSGLAEVGDKVRLHFVVIEDEVRWPGYNGRRLHGQVVRAALGDAAGAQLDRKDSTHTATLDVAALRQSLAAFRSELARQTNPPWADRPLELKHLAIVAFVQHEDTKKVYQAARLEVPPVRGKK